VIVATVLMCSAGEGYLLELLRHKSLTILRELGIAIVLCIDVEQREPDLPAIGRSHLILINESSPDALEFT